MVCPENEYLAQMKDDSESGTSFYIIYAKQSILRDEDLLGTFPYLLFFEMKGDDEE